MALEELEPLLWLGPSKYFVKSLVAVYEGMPEKRKKRIKYNFIWLIFLNYSI